jgi:hypothetical protein
MTAAKESKVKAKGAENEPLEIQGNRTLVKGGDPGGKRRSCRKAAKERTNEARTERQAWTEIHFLEIFVP